jgi:hypothetical protein
VSKGAESPSFPADVCNEKSDGSMASFFCLCLKTVEVKQIVEKCNEAVLLF